ncbi:MAG: beta-propeller domain-containing protein [Nitrososphaera sp.]|uniref:beta-propeller domain-containing protein n=1 Tax=Nitrososphaera sp. TaxID=1971748 RepID=UPI003D6F3A0F
MARLPMYGMAGIGIAAAIGFVFILSSISSSVPIGEITRIDTRGDQPDVTTLAVASTQKLNKFSSIDDLKAFLLNTESVRSALSAASGGSGVFNGIQERTLESADSAAPQSTAPAPASPEAKDGAPVAADSSYSTTNVQVAGVDEPDFVKNDGKYAYVLSGDKLTIAEVYPAESAKVVAKIGLDIQQGQQLQNMFLSNNTLVVLYQEYSEDYVIPQYEFAPQPVYAPKTHAIVLDITDRASPKVTDNYSVMGAYSNARLIGDYAYLVTTSDLYNYRQPLIPKIAGPVTIVPDIYYFDNPEPYYNFNTVTSINIKGGDGAVNSKTFMMNPASTLYVSEGNIYIAYQKYQPYGFYEQESRDRFFGVVVPLLSDDAQMRIRTIDADSSLSQAQKWDRISAALQDMYNLTSEQDKAALIEKIQKALGEYDARLQRDSMRTVVHKIAIGQAGELDYVAKGEVPGRLLNQFSMDESGGRFRLATTVEYYSPYSQGLYSNVYVLNGQMETVGKLEQIEPGESIYAARFIGERLYLVTFQRIDPLFVIDLSADQPRILGELKLPGYSSYLHPYDENHIIGVGKDAKENEFGGVQATGVKVALFDVSDVSKPRLVDDHIIEGQGTDSEALNDHKAFLFDKSRNLLSLPVSSYDAEPRYEPDGKYIPPKTWRGFYVFNLSAGDGISLKGTIEHGNATDYYYGQGSRSFYIGSVLYTVSANNLIKMNDIGTLQELNKLDIGGTGGIINYPVPLDDIR